MYNLYNSSRLPRPPGHRLCYNVESYVQVTRH